MAAQHAQLSAGLSKGCRPASMPRAIFLDMDGSVLNDAHEISPRTKAVFERYRAAGQHLPLHHCVHCPHPPSW